MINHNNNEEGQRSAFTQEEIRAFFVALDTLMKKLDQNQKKDNNEPA